MENPVFQSEYPLRDIDLCLKESIEILNEIFGVDNLSNIECAHLRRIAKDTVEKERKGDLNSNPTHVSLGQDASIRFLEELYGIDCEHIRRNTHTREDDEGFREYIRRTRERSHLI